MGCAYRSSDGICLRGIKNLKCVEHRCVHWSGDEDRSTPKEENYQAYIDELHREIEELELKLFSAEGDAEMYKEAILKAFLKWSDKEN